MNGCTIVNHRQQRAQTPTLCWPGGGAKRDAFCTLHSPALDCITHNTRSDTQTKHAHEVEKIEHVRASDEFPTRVCCIHDGM